MADKSYELAISPEMGMLQRNKEEGFNYRWPRQQKWNEIYPLYRDTVRVNRLTQRQSVNLPIMKTIIRTVIANSDDLPVIEFQSLDNDDQAQIFQNEYWKWTLEQNNAEIFDIVDKRQEYLFGRSFDQWQIVNGKIKFTSVPCDDILIGRFTDPVSHHSSRYLIHVHIFRALSELEETKEYDQEAIADLKQWYGSESGLIKLSTNQRMLTEKNLKMSDLGVQDIESPVLGETTVELAMHFVYRKEDDDDEEQLYLYVEAEGKKVLMKKRLEEVIGVTEDHFWRNHFPYNSWADDVENQAFWSDGIGDIILTPQKVANVWFSQMVENRTLKNFNMNVFDSTIEGYNPQTFTPQPFGWYPVPGKPQEVYQQLQVNDLGDTLPEMTFLIQMIEKAAGASATQQGAASERQITLGEVKLALSQSQERVKSLTKFYTRVWKQRAEMFLKLIEAAPDKLDSVKIYKQGRNTTKLYPRDIAPPDWMRKSGYVTRVWSQEEKNSQDEQALQKLNAALMSIPGNQKLLSVYQRRLLEYAEVKPDEVTAIMDEEENRKQMALEAASNGTALGGIPGQTPTGGSLPAGMPGGGAPGLPPGGAPIGA